MNEALCFSYPFPILLLYVCYFFCDDILFLSLLGFHWRITCIMFRWLDQDFYKPFCLTNSLFWIASCNGNFTLNNGCIDTMTILLDSKIVFKHGQTGVNFYLKIFKDFPEKNFIAKFKKFPTISSFQSESSTALSRLLGSCCAACPTSSSCRPS